MKLYSLFKVIIIKSIETLKVFHNKIIKILVNLKNKNIKSEKAIMNNLGKIK